MRRIDLELVNSQRILLPTRESCFPIKVQARTKSARLSRKGREYLLDTLLILWRNDLRLVRPLEPSQVLLVESPRSLLELFCCQILLIRPNLVVKDVEQRIRVEAAKHGWLIENGSRLLWIVMRRWIRLFRDVVLWPAIRQST